MGVGKFFEIIRDGTWHKTNELASQLEISDEKLNELLQLLADRHIITYDKNAKRVKIDPEWKTLLPIEEVP